MSLVSALLNRDTRHSTAWGDEVSFRRLALHTVLLQSTKSWTLIIDIVKLIKRFPSLKHSAPTPTHGTEHFTELVTGARSRSLSKNSHARQGWRVEGARSLVRLDRSKWFLARTVELWIYRAGQL